MSNFLMQDVFGTPLLFWAVFLTLVGLLMAFDLGVLHRKSREIEVRESLWLSAFYIAVALVFGAGVAVMKGTPAALDYLTGYFVEKSLSLDNVFVIATIFAFFAIPRVYQHRVLFWGILGVIVMRALLIAGGAALLHNFSWTLYVFGAFLFVTGVKMLIGGNHAPDLANNPILKFLKRRFNVTETLHGERFLVRLPDAAGKLRLYMTPLLLALILVELADLLFAVDSVPAIFAITQDPFIVYTSNIFAILGLRALYFALAAMVNRFRYLGPALALVLIFIAGKIFAAELVGKVPAVLSLGVTLGIIAGGVILSLWRTREKASI